jgi:ribonuclease HI
MTLDPRVVQIYTDGSAFRNPGHGSGCAAIVRYPEHLNREDQIIVDFGCPKSTNQRMELMACLEGLKWVRENMPWSGVTCVLLVTDSQYVKKYIGVAPEWKKHDWRNREGQPILNMDLWDNLVKARVKARIRVEFVWEAGKTSDIGNRVHKIAKAAAKRGGPDQDTGYKPGKAYRSMVEDGVVLPYPATGQIAVIRPYGKRPLRKDEDRVKFNVFDEAKQTYESQFYASATPLMAFDLHGWHGYRVRFNDNPKYPQILECIEEVTVPTQPVITKVEA